MKDIIIHECMASVKEKANRALIMDLVWFILWFPPSGNVTQLLGL